MGDSVEVVPERKKVLMLAVPTTGSIHHSAVDSLMALAYNLAKMESKGWKVLMTIFPRMLVAQAREMAMQKALELNADYLLFIDDDHVFDCHIFESLLAHDKDIVGSLSYERLGEHKPNIYRMMSYRVDGQGAEEQGTARWTNLLDYESRMDEKGLVEVDVIGFGLVLINMRVLKGPNAIQGPYFLSQWQVGEDFWFCKKAKDKGWRVFADCKNIALHIGENQVIGPEVFKGIVKENMQNELKKKDVIDYNLELMKRIVEPKPLPPDERYKNMMPPTMEIK